MEKKMTPAIRFKGFNNDWEQRKLGEVADIVGGGTPSTGNPEYWNGDIDWYSPTEIGDCVYAKGSIKKITKLGLEKSSAKILPPDRTVLFTSRAGIGDMAILQHQGATNQGFQSLVLNEGVDTYFIYSMGHLIKKYAEKNASGSTFLEISGRILGDMPISMPSTNEQTQIGTFFKQLDNLITLHQRKHDKLIFLKKSMLEKMFPQKGEKIPEVRFSGFNNDWEQRKLGEVAKFSKGKGYSKNDLTEEGTPIILYGSLYTNYQTVINKVNTFTLDKVNSVYSLGNEVVVPSSGESAEDIARASAIVSKGIILGGDLNIIHSNSNIDPIFLALLISNGERKIELAKKAQGKSVVHLYNTDLEEVNLIYPAREEQARISDFFSSIDNLITLHQRKVEKLKIVKKSMLEKMFV